MVKYVYDAWGNHAVLNANGEDISEDSAHIGNLNPFRYRGYFYDSETDLYYLQTRYYDPEVGRFITIDGVEYLDPETINGLNLYAYCGNNPVMRTDSNGSNWWTDFWGGVGNWFKGVGRSIKNFFVHDVYEGVLKPAWNWVSGTAAPAVGKFFTDTIPNWWNNVSMQVGTWTLKNFVNPTVNFFSSTLPNFFVNTVWNNWIVDKFWNTFCVKWIYQGGILPAWNWASENWRIILDVISAIASVGSGATGILAAIGVVSIPVVGQILLGVTSIGFGIYGFGRAFNWW